MAWSLARQTRLTVRKTDEAAWAHRASSKAHLPLGFWVTIGGNPLRREPSRLNVLKSAWQWRLSISVGGINQCVSRLLDVLAIVALVGCATSNVQFYGQIDPTEKTISLPLGSSLLLGPFKQSLSASGWKIAVGEGSETRYRLALRQRQFDVCLGTGLPMVAYDLSLVDNKTGEEIMTASGKDCVDLAARWFSDAVNSNGENYCTASVGRFCSRTVELSQRAEVAPDFAKTKLVDPSPLSLKRTEASLVKKGGTFEVPVLINGVIQLDFTVDSGAADVSIPADVVLVMIRTGTLKDSDFLGTQTYRLADGSTVPSHTFHIRSLKVGDRVIENIIGSVANVEGSLLLGQSFLSRFHRVSFDYSRQVMVLE
jgi:predicted aspartyl protease